jgi:hypothetical protein
MMLCKLLQEKSVSYYHGDDGDGDGDETEIRGLDSTLWLCCLG